MKKNWLENAEKRIEAKEEDNKRRLGAAKALTEGGTWKWNPAANQRETRKDENGGAGDAQPLDTQRARLRAAQTTKEKDHQSTEEDEERLLNDYMKQEWIQYREWKGD